MFISDVHKKEECRAVALQELRNLGVKCRVKKPKQHVQTVKNVGKRVFNVPLAALPTETVTLRTGQQLAVPKLVHELCSLILTKVNTEGIFRKEGSRNRQQDIKLILNAGGLLEKDTHVIDLAVILKIFLRELPDPLISSGYHELFLRCAILEPNLRIQAIFLACLLLPIESLNTLTYLMQFLFQVSEYSKKNKMTSYNLAVVFGPNIFPIEEKLSPTNAQARAAKITEIIQILIENSTNVGVIPEGIIEQLTKSSSMTDLKKKKRRSGSLTRMLNGIKKIVGGKVEDSHNVVTPDLLLTPINNNIVKKRRLQTNGLSNRKKKELLNKLPDNLLLSTPFTPCRTPVSMDLSGEQEQRFKDATDVAKEKKSQWFLRSRSVKNLKCEENGRKNPNTKTALERRWSAITHPNNVKRGKKRNSFAASLSRHKETNLQKLPTREPEPDYVRVPVVEFEEFKIRVSAMERRISLELESVQSQIKTENENNKNVEVDKNIQNVQTVYEQTLEQAEHLSPTTDHLAKRLSRELKIRRSADQKVIRSPSARKIGSMRRKSKEFQRSNSKVMRHQSWHAGPNDAIIPRVGLKRGRPNTVLTGLPVNNEVFESRDTKRTRASSVELHKPLSCNLSGSSSDNWESAEGFFATYKSTNDSSSLSDRSSLARLRSQNAGMVLAKAKLFDQLNDSSSSSSSSSVRSIPRPKVGNKIGSCRNIDNRLSYRIRALKYEDRRISRKSMSPRKRNGQLLSHKQKLQIAKQYLDSSTEKNSDKENVSDNLINMPLKDCNRIDGQYRASPKTARIPPHIKKPLNVRSPKRLYRTPVGVDRGTPLRVLKTPVRSHIV